MRKIHSLNLGAHELLYLHNTKEISIQPGSNYQVLHSHTKSESDLQKRRKQTNPKKIKQPKKVRRMEWETQSVVSLMS